MNFFVTDVIFGMFRGGQILAQILLTMDGDNVARRNKNNISYRIRITRAFCFAGELSTGEVFCG